MAAKPVGCLLVPGAGEAPDQHDWAAGLKLPFPIRLCALDETVGADATVLVAVIGKNVEFPLPQAQFIHSRWPEARILILRGASEGVELQRRIMLTPGLGLNVRVVSDVDGASAIALLREQLTLAEQQVGFRRDLQIVSTHLQASPVRAPTFPVSVHALLQLLPIGVVVLDHHDRLSYQNDVAVKMGSERSGSEHEAPWRNWPSDAASTMVQLLERARAQQCAVSGTIALGGGARMVRHVDVLVEAGLAVHERGVVVALQDVTQRVVAESAKSRFLANISHEFRTPLSAIICYGEILRNDLNSNSEHAKAVQTITSSAEHLLGLVDDVLDFSTLDAGPQELQVADFDLAECLDGISRMIVVSCEKRQLNWVCDVALSRPCRVRGDQLKIGRILINLLSNAVKFTHAGEVRLSVLHKNGQFRFEVSDTGVGIPADEQGKVAQAFYRGAGAESESGAGLGLSICARLLQLMDSELELDSVPGQGSHFKFGLTLPLSRSPELELPAHCSEIPRLEPGRELAVLVVDDHQAGREVLCHWLRAAGAKVCEASNGREALALIRRRIPDLVILDLHMPIMDGFTTLAQLRSHPRWRGISCIAVTASCEGIQPLWNQERGFAACLHKPFNVHELFAVISRATGLQFETAPSLSALPVDDGDGECLAAAESGLPYRESLAQLRESSRLCDVDEINRILSRSPALPRSLRAQLAGFAKRYDFAALESTLATLQSAQRARG